MILDICRELVRGLLGQKVTEKGVLIIRDSMLSGDLTLDTENVLKIVAGKAISLEQPNFFTGVLVDTASVSESSEAWLDTWADVEFTARAYFELEDGTVIYSDAVTKSITSVREALVG